MVLALYFRRYSIKEKYINIMFLDIIHHPVLFRTPFYFYSKQHFGD
jgi:hypothetical protein